MAKCVRFSLGREGICPRPGFFFLGPEQLEREAESLSMRHVAAFSQWRKCLEGAYTPVQMNMEPKKGYRILLWKEPCQTRILGFSISFGGGTVLALHYFCGCPAIVLSTGVPAELTWNLQKGLPQQQVSTGRDQCSQQARWFFLAEARGWSETSWSWVKSKSFPQ